MFRLIWGLLLVSLVGCSAYSTRSANDLPGKPVELVVVVDGIKSVEGRLMVFIHDNEFAYHADDDIHSDQFSAFKYVSVTPDMPSTTVRFEAVPEGRYAISCYQDEDGDGTLDRQIFPFIGMPTEPYGISNHVYSFFSKASFDAALVDVKATGSEVHIHISTHLTKVFGGS